MKFAPVIVFAYKRIDHIKKTLECLNKSPLASLSDIFIFCDGYKGKHDKDEVIEVQEYCLQFVEKSSFKASQVFISNDNKGLAASVIGGVTKVINKYGKAIVIEDDLVTSKDFLSFMNSALDYYYDKKKIWSICGCSFPIKAVLKSSCDVYLMKRSSSWGWATWLDRWNTIDWNVSDYNNFKHNWFKRIAFGKWGGDLPIMLDQQMNKNINSWAIRWCYSQYKQDKWSVFPKYSLVKNIGLDGSGTHNGNTNEFDIKLFEEHKDYDFSTPLSCKNIRKSCAKKYNGKFSSYIRNHLKAFLQRIGVIKY